MNRVRVNALNIFEEIDCINSEDIPSCRRIVVAAAQFHDIADHKYCVDPKEEFALMSQELSIMGFTDDEISSVILICDSVSYSKETRHGIDYSIFDKSSPKYGRLIRDIVSDADKLEAIGMVGIKRCWMYSKEKNNLMDETNVQNEVTKHLKNRLLGLYPGYFRTEVGLRMAKPLHDELVEYIGGIRPIYNS